MSTRFYEPAVISRVLVMCKQGHHVELAEVKDLVGKAEGSADATVLVTYLDVRFKDVDMEQRERYAAFDEIAPIDGSDSGMIESFPAVIDLWCQRHGDFQIHKSKLLAELAVARRTGETVTIRVRQGA